MKINKKSIVLLLSASALAFSLTATAQGPSLAGPSQEQIRQACRDAYDHYQQVRQCIDNLNEHYNN